MIQCFPFSAELLNDTATEEILVPQDVTTPMKLHTGLLPKSPSTWRNESNAPNIVVDADMACPAISDQIQNPSPENTAGKVKESDSPSTNISSR